MKNHFLLEAYKFINPSQRKKGVEIIFLLTLSSLLDFFSLAFFLPLIFLLIDPKTLQSNLYFQHTYNFFGFNTISSFAITFTGAIFLFIVLKTLIIVWIAKRTASYGYSIGSDLASRAVSRYLKIPYLQFTQAELANEVNLIANLPLMLANNIIIPTGTLFSEVLIFVLLLTAIAIYNINVFAFLLMILLPAFFIYRLRREKIKNIGIAIRNLRPLLFSHTFRIVEGLQDIRAFGKESFFRKEFEKVSNVLSRTLALDQASQASAPRITEIIGAWCVCMMITYTLLSQHDQKETLILLSIYAGVGFRIIPSVNRILTSIQQMKVHEYNVMEFSRILNEVENPRDDGEWIGFKEKITLKNISFGYPGQSGILNNINLSLYRGEKIALTGQSGAGKTSLLLILLRFLQEQEGELSIDGHTLEERHCFAWRKLLGYVPQNPYILDGSALENIAFGIPPEHANPEKASRLIHEMDLEDWMLSLPEGIHTRIGEKGAKISGGQRQRIAIARALYHGAEVLLLDEVTNHLDPETEKEVISTLLNISDRSKTIVMITHNPELLKKFDAVYELAHGVLKKVTENAIQSTEHL